MKRSQLERKPLKRSQPKRDWTPANHKRDEGCRFRFGSSGECGGPVELAHVIGRECDIELGVGGPEHIYGEKVYPVWPERVFPACRTHHRAYDAHALDALPILTVDEQAQAVLDAGGLELARNRICGL